MKKQLFIFAILIYFIPVNSFSQSCPTNSGSTFYLLTQSSVDDFAVNYPDCSVLSYNLRINGDDITNLASLSNITHIEGYLRVFDCPNLQSLDGLQNIVQVDDYIRIADNPFLEDISALSGIELLGEDFVLDELPLLSTFGQFLKLDSIKGEFRIDAIMDLPINSFPQLKSVNALIIRNNLFTSFSGFTELVTVIEDIQIRNNPLLVQLSGFSQLETIGTDLTIEGNVLLEEITGFDNLTTIENSLELHDSPALNNIEQAFNTLESIGDIFSIESVGLSSLSGFKKMQTIGSLLIHDNINLSSFSGLEELTVILTELSIKRNSSLTDISAIQAVDYELIFNGSSDILSVIYNPLLEDCDIQLICDLLKRTEPYFIEINNNGTGCMEVDDVLIGKCKSHRCFEESLYVSSEDEIESLFSDLPVCSYIVGDLIIGDNAILADNQILDLSQLSFIDTIMGDVIIENTLLKEVRGLTDVRHIGGKMRIVNNPNLEFADFFYLSMSYKEFIVQDNPKLREVSRIHLSGMTGDVIFRNNPLLEALDIEFDSFYEGDIIIEDNAELNLDLDFNDLNVLDGSLHVKNIRRNNFLNADKVTGDIILDNVGTFPQYATINSDTILGSVIIQNNPEITTVKLIRLKYIGGNLDLINNEKLELFTPFGSANDPELRYIGGDFKIINSMLDDKAIKEEMELLRTVGGALVISDNPKLEALTAFNSLIYNTTSSITITNNNVLEDCDLKTLCWQMANNPGSVEIFGNSGNCLDYQNAQSNCDLETCIGSLGAYKQEQIERWLEINEICSVIPGSMSIKDSGSPDDILSLLELKNIVSVSGNVTFGGGELDSLTGLENLRTIGGDLTFENNDAVFDMSALRNLESVGGKLSSNISRLTNFDGLEKLERVGELRLSQEEHIESLEGFKALKRIDRQLTLRFLDITSLKGLENLEYVGERIEIFSLDELTDISALKNIPAEPLERIKIESNDKLTECNYQLFCEFIHLYPPTPLFILWGNGEGCFDDDLECDLFSLSGTVYYDTNQNGLKDPDEYGIPNITLEKEIGSVLTNEKGRYRQFFENGDSYSIAIGEDPKWTLTSMTEEYFGEVDSTTFLSDFNFGLVANFDEHAIDLNITSNNIRCSEKGTYYLKIQNAGTFAETGEVHMQYDTDLSFISTDRIPSFHDEQAGIIKWSLEDLAPFETIEIELEMEHPDFNSAGDLFESKLEFYSSDGNDFNLLSEYAYETILRCSYDPNDKQVSPVGRYDEAYLLKDEPLTYTIRFQNTGNDFARNIILVDTLPSAVNLVSFKLVNASHEVFVEMNGYEVTFNFNNIYLIDSLTNPSLSQGFVSFQLLLNEDIEDYTEIENNAEIFFDFNPPIQTNTVTNTVVEDFPTSTFEAQNEKQWTIYPNPFDRTFSLLAKESGSVRIYDISFRLLESMELIDGYSKIEMSQYPSGIYFIALLNKRGELTWDKLIKR